MNNLSYYIRKHEFTNNADGCGTSTCKYCNSAAGIGFHFITECILRFNEEGFKYFLRFKNISQGEDGKYFKRYSSESYTRKELEEEFKLCCDEEETNKIINEKHVCTNRG